MRRVICALVLMLLAVLAAGCEPSGRTVILGDSHAYGPGSWPTLLPCEVTVQSWPGWTLQASMDDPLASVEAGDRVILALGFNDLGSSDWAARRDAVIARLQARGATVQVATTMPLSLQYPLGEVLDPGEDKGDHVHLSASAQEAVAAAAAPAICGGGS